MPLTVQLLTAHTAIDMGAVLFDLHHACKSIWFSITILAVVISLWLGLGTDAYWLLHQEVVDPLELFKKALSGAGSAISLPLLAALPCAATAWQELSAGATRLAVFRCGRIMYMTGKLISVLLVAALAQAAGLMLFLRLLLMISPSVQAPFPSLPLLARLLTTMFFSAVGGTGALIAQDTVSAYAIPTALGFALSMLSARFFMSAKYVNPLSWLKGEPAAIGLLLLLISVASILYIASLRYEMNQYV